MASNSLSFCVFLQAIWMFSLSYVLKYFLNAYIAQHVPPSVFGDFFLAMSFMTMTAPFFILGTNASLIKHFPTYIATKDHAQGSLYLRWNLRTVIKTFSICIPIIVITGITILLLDHWSVLSLSKYHLAVFFQLASPLIGLITLGFLILLSMRKMFLSNLSKKLIKYLLFIPLSFILFSAVDGNNITNFYLFIVIFFGTLLWLFTTLILLFFSVGFDIRKYFNANTPKNLASEKEWGRYSKLLLFNSSMFALTGFLDLLIIEIIPHRGEHLVGYYAAIFTIIGMLWVPVLAIRQMLKPVLALKGNAKVQQQSLNRANLLQLSLLIMLVLIVTLFAQTFLGHFGPAYVQYGEVLRISVIGNAIALVPSLCFFDPLYKGYAKVLLIENYFNIAMTIIFGSLAYYYFGLIGIIWAVVIIRVTLKFSLFIYVKTKTKLKYMYFL